jgi:spermidine synthase
MTTPSTEWIEEIQEGSHGMKWKLKARLFKGQSPFQTVEVVETVTHGKMLLNDGLVMITERDERIYHEMLAHVPLFTHPHPENVLVIGGGDGGTIREVLRHPSVKHAVLCEIDAMVVEACREWIPQTAHALSDPRVQVHIADGVTFLKETAERYDVILVDSTDPMGPATPLFGRDFYLDAFNTLTDEGLVVAQAESGFLHLDTQRRLLSIVQEVFPQTYVYNYNNLTYPGGMWSFLVGSKRWNPQRDFSSDRLLKCDGDFYWYNADIHRSSFSLPTFMRKELTGIGNGS